MSSKSKQFKNCQMTTMEKNHAYFMSETGLPFSCLYKLNEYVFILQIHQYLMETAFLVYLFVFFPVSNCVVKKIQFHFFRSSHNNMHKHHSVPLSSNITNYENIHRTFSANSILFQDKLPLAHTQSNTVLVTFFFYV